MYAEKYQVEIKFFPDKNSSMINMDPDRLMQVITNLISNACKYSPKEKSVEISTSKIGEFARVSVRNYGPEIPEEFQSRIFQKFSQEDASNTRGKGGTGLGLNISKAIIEKLNGHINFESTKESTTFYFDLPIIKKASDDLDIQQTDTDDFNKRLLICEDDEDQAHYLQVLLESAGYQVDTAFSAKGAKKLLKSTHYSALLLDLILPDQDGISLLRELRANKNTKDLHIIVLSIIAKTGRNLLNGDALDVVDWLEKPIDFNKILTAIKRVKKLDSDNKPDILHIEDNPDQQHVVSMLLKDHAHVYIANDLHQAKEMLQKNRYDLVILDLLLPDGNGMEILPWLAKFHFPVVVLSNIELNQDYAKYVSEALLKSKSSNEVLLKTITDLL